MTPIKKYIFPIRMNAAQLPAVYPSLEQAFSAHDHLYVARYGRDSPELRGCSLLMLGNRVGGERILDQQNIRTGRSCFYRAYAAWQDGQSDEARRWIGEAKALGYPEDRLQRLSTLIDRQSFRIVCHWDFHNIRHLEFFRNLPGMEVIATRQLPAENATMLRFGQPLGSVLPPGAPLDLVLLDDVKMVPVGIADVGAPVVAVMHDIEWQYEFLDQVLPDIDLVSLGSTSEIVEVGRPFKTNTVAHFFPFHMSLPAEINIAESLKNTATRTVDLFYSGSIGHDFYRYKKQTVLPLARLDDRYAIKIEENFFPLDEFWKEMRQARFSIMSSRVCNYVSSRAMESIACGTFHLVEEEDAIPYFFSEPYTCFPVYRRDHVLEDVGGYLGNYDSLAGKFRKQLPRFEEEFKSALPADSKLRALRYLRHVLFMTHVEYPRRKANAQRPESKRKMVFVNEFNRFLEFPPPTAAQCVQQTLPPHWLRRAFGTHVMLATESKTGTEQLEGFLGALQEGINAQPDSLALHFMLGVCLKQLGKLDEADQNFIKTISGNLKLLPDDPSPVIYGRINSAFWINDARVRERCPKEAAPLVPALDVWKSTGWANRAEIALERGDYGQAAEFAQKSLELFAYNEDVQRLYLRAAFGLASSGQKEWADRFLQAFDAACHNDFSILHDFAAPAFHILFEAKRMPEALEVLKDLTRYMYRIKLVMGYYTLYKEFIPLLQRYGIPHSHVKAVVN